MSSGVRSCFACEGGILVNGLQHSDLSVLCKSICHTVDATTLHLELFQMVAPLYVSRLLLRVVRIGVKACIGVTLYDELFITSIIEKYFLSPLVTKDNLDRCPVIHSWTTLVPLDRLMARHTPGAVHSMAHYTEPMDKA